MDNTNDGTLTIVVLAAGLGTRMKSSLPKVLHTIGSKSLLSHVIDAAHSLSPEKMVIVHSKDPEKIKALFPGPLIKWAEQTTPRGTGDAASKALPFIHPSSRVLILYGDVPLISPETLRKLLNETPAGEVGLLTIDLNEPFGLGRIVRDNDKIIKIIEEKDATFDERQIKEINTGIFVVPGTLLLKWLPLLKNNNKQGEYYLTDIIEMANKEGVEIHSTQPKHEYEILGVNDRLQQANLERCYQINYAHQLLKEGVWIADPARFDVRGELTAQSDVRIDVNVLFEGKVSLAKGSHIGANCVLINCEIGENVTILPHCHLEGVKIHQNARIGPFARLRPGTIAHEGVHIGNFVEIKNSTLDKGSKINHLSYIGDTVMGKDVNVGAGTITCNFDGANKHQTIIEDDVHIGSDTQLIAPVCIGKGATIGAGSTIIHNVPSNELTLTQKIEQRHKPYKRPKKKLTESTE